MLFQPNNLSDFNCYSYAMGIRDEWLRIEGFIRGSNRDVNEQANFFAKENILKRFPDLIVVNFEDIKKGTRLIAFKVGSRDYHFMKRFPNGCWFQKMGGSSIQPIRTIDVFAKTWKRGYYNSKTIFLGYKEDY